MTSPRTVLTARIKDVLAGHEYRANVDPCCGCRTEDIGAWDDDAFDQWTAHLASVLTDTVAAGIWDEGAEWQSASPVLFDHHDNPYVRQAGDEG